MAVNVKGLAAVPHWIIVVLVLTACLATLARGVPTANATAVAEAGRSSSAEDVDDDGDVDFPEEPPQQAAPPPPPPRRLLPSPVSVYVLRLLEILTGAETMGKHTRYSRAAGDGYGYPDPVLPPESGRQVVNTAASYSNYYDFLINEGSYKFWAAFQIGTAVLLVYSAFAALYYARYTYYTNVDYTDYDDYFFRRSGRSQRSAPASASSSPFTGLSATEYQRVMDAVDGGKFKSPAASS